MIDICIYLGTEVTLLERKPRDSFLQALELLDLGGGLCLVVLERTLLLEDEVVLRVDLLVLKIELLLSLADGLVHHPRMIEAHVVALLVHEIW